MSFVVDSFMCFFINFFAQRKLLSEEVILIFLFCSMHSSAKRKSSLSLKQTRQFFRYLVWWAIEREHQKTMIKTDQNTFADGFEKYAG
jgi:hypothetical protein